MGVEPAEVVLEAIAAELLLLLLPLLFDVLTREDDTESLEGEELSVSKSDRFGIEVDGRNPE